MINNIKQNNNDCPYGFTFGIDIDYKRECENCYLWEECDEYNRTGIKPGSHEWKLSKDEDYKKAWEELNDFLSEEK